MLQILIIRVRARVLKEDALDPNYESKSSVITKFYMFDARQIPLNKVLYV